MDQNFQTPPENTGQPESFALLVVIWTELDKLTLEGAGITTTIVRH